MQPASPSVATNNPSQRIPTSIAAFPWAKHARTPRLLADRAVQGDRAAPALSDSNEFSDGCRPSLSSPRNGREALFLLFGKPSGLRGLTFPTAPPNQL